MACFITLPHIESQWHFLIAATMVIRFVYISITTKFPRTYHNTNIIHRGHYGVFQSRVKVRGASRGRHDHHIDINVK